MRTTVFLIRKAASYKLHRTGASLKRAEKKQPTVFAVGCYINQNIILLSFVLQNASAK